MVGYWKGSTPHTIEDFQKTDIQPSYMDVILHI